jgi:hypothetical protein
MPSANKWTFDKIIPVPVGMVLNFEKERRRRRLWSRIWKNVFQDCRSCGGVGAFGFNGEGRICEWCGGGGKVIGVVMRWYFVPVKPVVEWLWSLYLKRG